MAPTIRPRLLSSLEHRRDVVVKLEMMIHRPLIVDLPRHVDHLLAAPAHVLDDRGGVVDEQIVVVDLLLDLVEDDGRGGRSGIEFRRIDVDARARRRRGGSPRLETSAPERSA